MPSSSTPAACTTPVRSGTVAEQRRRARRGRRRRRPRRCASQPSAASSATRASAPAAAGPLRLTSSRRLRPVLGEVAGDQRAEPAGAAGDRARPVVVRRVVGGGCVGRDEARRVRHAVAQRDLRLVGRQQGAPRDVLAVGVDEQEAPGMLGLRAAHQPPHRGRDRVGPLAVERGHGRVGHERQASRRRCRSATPAGRRASARPARARRPALPRRAARPGRARSPGRPAARARATRRRTAGARRSRSRRAGRARSSGRRCPSTDRTGRPSAS